MAEKLKEDRCANCSHPRGVHGLGMCIGPARVAQEGVRAPVGCEAFAEPGLIST